MVLWRPLCPYGYHYGLMVAIVPLWWPLWCYGGHCALMAAVMPLWSPLCPYGGHCPFIVAIVLLWPPLCPYGGHCALMVTIVPLWWPLWPYGDHCALMVTIVPLWRPRLSPRGGTWMSLSLGSSAGVWGLMPVTSAGGEAEADRAHAEREAHPAGRHLPLPRPPRVFLQGGTPRTPPPPSLEVP